MGMRSRTVWIAALALAATASLATAATKQQSRSVEILDGTSWNGKQVPAGEYKIVWQADGADLKVTVMNGHHVVAEGRGRIEERSQKAPADAVVSRRDGSGVMAMAELQLGGKKEVLVFAGS